MSNDFDLKSGFIEIIELFNNLDDNEQEEFFRKTGRISTKKKNKSLI
ncbi:hypothetical protein ACUWOI_000551 [Campylobacter jejuni]